jgi:hypothetical protein
MDCSFTYCSWRILYDIVRGTITVTNRMDTGCIGDFVGKLVFYSTGPSGLVRSLEQSSEVV